jgi:hypothetical protein
MDVTSYSDKGESFSARGEIHAGHILEPRSIQDVWIIARTGVTLLADMGLLKERSFGIGLVAQLVFYMSMLTIPSI